MPIKKSAIKTQKQSIAKRKRNLIKKRALKEVVKKTDSREGLPKAQSTIDKIAKTGFIHKNKANRIKSRLSKKIKASGK